MSSGVKTLGKYEIRRELGRGAMGTVCEGWDPIIERVVAIKTVNLPEVEDEDTAEAIARFRREAQAAGRLQHPNIVGVFDYGEAGGVAYIVMEFVDGPPLKSVLDKKERFPLPMIVRIMEDLLAGLQFSHERGVVHRDIKPANLMLTKSGQAKIADFGIARIESSNMTQAGTVLGTPAYMSPEQVKGEVVDARSDIYSSGVLLYQLLTGERPFEGSMSSIMHKVLNVEPEMPSQISVTAPRAFDPVIRRAMAKRPEDRFASASEFMMAIRAALVAPAPPPDPREDEEATMVVTPRGGAGSSQTGAARGTGALNTSSSGTTGTASQTGTARTGGDAGGKQKSSKAPLLIGSGVAGLALVGGLGYFLFAPDSNPVIVRPDPPPLSDPAAEQARKDQEARLATEQARRNEETRLAAEQTRRNEEARLAAEQARKNEEARLAAEQAKREQDARLTAAERARRDEEARLAAERAKREEDARLAAERAKRDEEARLAAERARKEEQARREEQARNEEIARQAALVDASRQELAGFLSRQSCSLIDGELRDGQVSLTGLGGRGVAETIKKQLTALGLARQPPSLRLAELPAVFCSWMDALRPASAGFGTGNSRLSLRLLNDRTELREGEHIQPRLVMGNFRGEIHVDYIDRDGNVRHLYPQLVSPAENLAADVPRMFEPGQPLDLGEVTPSNVGWAVEPPFGTDLIIAVASEDALFDRPRTTNVEKASVYLQDLKRAVEAARARGARITAEAILVETRPNKAAPRR